MPREQIRPAVRRGGRGAGAAARGASATGAVASGAVAIGAIAAGALAIGALAIGRFTVGAAHIRRLRIDNLVVGRLNGRTRNHAEAPVWSQAIAPAAPPGMMERTDGRLFFDDLTVGQRWQSGTVPVETPAIKSFAAAFDPQPFHLDEQQAEATLFGGLAASGWHTAALTMRLIATGVPLAGGIVGAGGEIAWPRPTRPGDVLRVESEVLELTPSRSRPDRGMATVRSTTLNQRNEVVQTLTARLVVPRRPAAAGSTQP
jgi:acyl dehydratase